MSEWKKPNLENSEIYEVLKKFKSHIEQQRDSYKVILDGLLEVQQNHEKKQKEENNG